MPQNVVLDKNVLTFSLPASDVFAGPGQITIILHMNVNDTVKIFTKLRVSIDTFGTY